MPGGRAGLPNPFAGGFTIPYKWCGIGRPIGTPRPDRRSRKGAGAWTCRVDGVESADVSRSLRRNKLDRRTDKPDTEVGPYCR